MTRYDIPSGAFLEKNMLASGTRWLWLYEITVPTTPPTVYRLVRDDQPVTFREQVYSPFPLAHSLMTETNTGDLPKITLTASNVARELIDTLNSYGGLIGQAAKIILTHEVIVGTGGRVWESEYRIVNTTANENDVSMTLGDFNLYEMKIPAQRLLRYYCRHAYQSGACGYSVNNSDANYLSTCDKTLYGANGCIVHGASEALGGAPVVHPERFGGFPGIPEPQTTGGI